MCISLKASLNTFLIGLFSSLGLVFFGNKELYAYNIIVAGIFIFVSLMQLVDFGIWLDLDCTKGTNKLATIVGPVLNWFQPTVVFIIIYCVLKYTTSGKKIYNNHARQFSKYNNILSQFDILSKNIKLIHIINIVYIIIVCVLLALFYTKAYSNPGLLCTKVQNGNLNWSWYGPFNSTLIIGVLWHISLLNLLAFRVPNVYMLFTLVITYIFLFTVYVYKKTSTAEIWCYIVNFVPIIMLVIQKFLPDLMLRNLF